MDEYETHAYLDLAPEIKELMIKGKARLIAPWVWRDVGYAREEDIIEFRNKSMRIKSSFLSPSNYWLIELLEDVDEKAKND